MCVESITVYTGKDTRMQTANITVVDPHTRSAELQTSARLHIEHSASIETDRSH